MWILDATVSSTLYSIFLKRWLTSYSPIAVLVLIDSGGVLMLPPSTAVDALSGVPMTQTTWGWRTAALVVAATLIPGDGAFLAYTKLQKALGIALAGLTLYLSPLCAAVAAVVFLGEAVSAHYVLGTCVLLPGIYLYSRAAKARI